MGLWSFLALVVVCGSVVALYRSFVESRGARGGGNIEQLEARVRALEANGSLEERVQTLEAIVTDRKYQLDAELNDLER